MVARLRPIVAQIAPRRLVAERPRGGRGRARGRDVAGEAHEQDVVLAARLRPRRRAAPVDGVELLDARGVAADARRVACAQAAARGIERDAARAVAPARARALQHAFDIAVQPILLPEPARLQGGTVAERDVDSARHVVEDVRQVDVAHAQPVGTALEHVEPRAPRGDEPGRAVVARTLLEGDLRARHGDVGDAADHAVATTRARAQVDHRRHPLSRRDRPHARVKVDHAQHLRRDRGQHAHRVDGVEERQAVERDTRLRPRRAPTP